MKTIVIVGGGAGGLELVTRLSKTLGRKNLARIVLVDRSRTHVWKPLLHEVAAGVIDKTSDGVEYAMHAARHGYTFQWGNLSAIDPEHNTITLDPLLDDQGREILPSRELDYDELVLAIGSVSNDFGTPGVSQHCYLLDALPQAERFHKALLNQLLRLHQLGDPDKALQVAIVGGGATGTELAAQLHHVANLARHYGMPMMSAKRLKLTLIEAGPRILPALPARIAAKAKHALTRIGVDVLENTRVSEATEQGFVTAAGEVLAADLMVWAAGVKAPDFLAAMDLFDINRAQQIRVTPTLQSTRYDTIWAIGDCCGFEQADGSWVPPRAQSAHQMATTVANNLRRQVQGKPLLSYHYTDYGSLVHLSRYSTVGSLMGKLTNSSMFIEGHIARLMYISLYNLHQFAVHGWLKGVLVLLNRKIGNIVGARFKLH
ncbi:NAD(P)/FAD-dependent oxidoreductase [Aestuariibacter halophilus]|uniref:NAD(P)/FAD-dependent oxidoreductase n=1 Tax=Fluctibacter halophilus TaxID=226011 RepID=A0ABS8G9Q7_9ALTE|nr:NAD(P)/FAD-dependent oxidoreductase [Aestuariibacter halophilus]MCC2616545.1 NAD(P)/FAD-dependent oxidoreductase [Aestuariibacter halophilus]